MMAKGMKHAPFQAVPPDVEAVVTGTLRAAEQPSIMAEIIEYPPPQQPHCNRPDRRYFWRRRSRKFAEPTAAFS
jgi:hypothetical protein